MSQLNQPDQNRTSTIRLFIALCSLTLIYSCLSFYKPPEIADHYTIFRRSWGFDHILFYPAPFIIVFYLLVACILIPVTNTRLQGLLTAAAQGLANLRQRKLLLFLLVSAVSIPVFYLLRIKYVFLGDINLRLDQVLKKQFLATEYLTMRLLYLSTQLGSRTGIDAQRSFVLYSCAAGGFFIFIQCLIADLLGKQPLQKLLFFMAGAGSAIALVFCGYIEVYATPVVFVALYIYCGLRYLNHKGGFYPVLIALALAIASHLIALMLLPSLALLWYFTHKEQFAPIAKMNNRRLGITVAALIFIATAVILNTPNSFTLPLTSPPSMPNYMTFFSVSHFWEVLNGQLLAGGLSFLFTFILLWNAIQKKIAFAPSVYFLLCITGFFLWFVVIVNLHRGSCDWDIMAFTALSLNALALLLIRIVYKDPDPRGNYLATAMVLLNVIQAGMWIDINHTDRSIRKIEAMLVDDPGTYYTSRISGRIHLIIVYKLNKLWTDAERAGRDACNLPGSGQIKGCTFYAKNLAQAGRNDEASKVFEDIFRRSPFVPEAYLFLIDYYNKQQNEAQIYAYLDALFDAFVQKPEIFLNNNNVSPKVYVPFFELVYAKAERSHNSGRMKHVSVTIQKLKSMGLSPG